MSVELQVEGVDLAQEATQQAIATSDLSSALWSKVNGIATATVYPTSNHVPSEVLEFARQLASLVPGARAIRVHRDLVSASDIAHRTGFSRETVRKWASGSTERSFPTPFGAVGDGTRTSKVWLWPDVADWLITNYALPIEKDWPDESTVAHIDACLARVPDYATQEWHALKVWNDTLELALKRHLQTCRPRAARVLATNFASEQQREIAREQSGVISA
ncbi:hypothetical protein F5X71_08495 [Nocardia brasiliensis]|uniref:DNA-binding protein n=1 Tax=Nocardia brasiliensis TaxID=37326 RepID=A0A6G9XN83_NOCBR|nr:hypothetical protein [Nocardia brasiliensis]QIS02358.1 hypothetical protein F5X71_08495 [Nocardia brasiliensis]